MALVQYLLFVSLLSHSILLSKCDEEDELIQGINQYRRTLNLPVLTTPIGVDCIANEIADTYNNRLCPTTTYSKVTTLSDFPNYSAILTKCLLNKTVNGQILSACVPDQLPELLPTNFVSNFTTYLHSILFSTIGVASEDNWMIVVLTNMKGGGSNVPPAPTNGAPPPAYGESTLTDAEDILQEQSPRLNANKTKHIGDEYQVAT